MATVLARAMLDLPAAGLGIAGVELGVVMLFLFQDE
jgi:hypothetical protein